MSARVVGSRSAATFAYRIDLNSLRASTPAVESPEISGSPASSILSWQDPVQNLMSERYLESLNSAEWRKHDLYKILGIGHLRYLATESDIKNSYRQKILQHHPDKKSSQSEDEIFKCVQKGTLCACLPCSV